VIGLLSLWEDELFFGTQWADALIRLALIVGFMTVTAMMLIWLERKFVGRIQQRLGPTRTGPIGLLQSVADAGKLLAKEDLRPTTADSAVFQLAPFVFFVPIFLGFVAVPYTRDLGVRGVGGVALPLGLFFIIAVSSVSIVGMLMAGLASDNKYALLGAIRAVAQMISYEIPLVLSVLAIAMMARSMDLRVITEQQSSVPNVVWQPLGFFLFLTAATAEMARRPFDLPVAESELVGGPHVEYSGIRWSMFFLAEYTNLFILSAFGSVLFFGGYAWPFGADAHWIAQAATTVVKTTVLILVFMWIGATFPRLRIDQLMTFAWKVLIPLTFVQIFITGLVETYDWPHIIMGVASAAALVLASVVVRRRVRNTIRRPREERLAYLARRQAARAASQLQ
jgi:NADH-quinone oxidoreductase subunit H